MYWQKRDTLKGTRLKSFPGKMSGSHQILISEWTLGVHIILRGIVLGIFVGIEDVKSNIFGVK